VYAHHPYADVGNEPPSYVPRGKDRRRVQLGNIDLLLSELSRYYGPKHLWITEYGYQTNPPDRTIEGTSWARQALYMKQAFALARDGWFVVNARDARWLDGDFGAYTRFEGEEARFPRLGINIGVLAPGQPACMYHGEDEQEDFLVLAGECLLLIEGEERPLRA